MAGDAAIAYHHVRAAQASAVIDDESRALRAACRRLPE